MRVWIVVVALLLAPALALGDANRSHASAAVQVKISLSSQRMNVNVDGTHYATWAISTGRQGYGTPAGTFFVRNRCTRCIIRVATT